MAKRKPNLFGRRRPITAPYAIYKSGDWEYRVLKTYKRVDREDKYSAWYCGVKSPYTGGSYELGDVYADEVRQLPLVSAEDSWREAYN